MPHSHAILTETGRLHLARLVIEEGWPLGRATERYGVAVTTARRWALRYRNEGPAGIRDRSSTPQVLAPPALPGRRVSDHALGMGPRPAIRLSNLASKPSRLGPPRQS